MRLTNMTHALVAGFVVSAFAATGALAQPVEDDEPTTEDDMEANDEQDEQKDEKHKHEKQPQGDQDIIIHIDPDEMMHDDEAKRDLSELSQMLDADEGIMVVLIGNPDELRARTQELLVSGGIPEERLIVLTPSDPMPQRGVDARQRVVFLVVPHEMSQSPEQGGQTIQPEPEPEIQPQPHAEPQPPPAEPLTEADYERTRDDDDSDSSTRHLVTPGGLSINIGGGLLDYIDDDARAFTGTAGTWEARLIYGTRMPVAVEAAYVGSAQTVDALGLDSSAYLLGSMFEGALRVNSPFLARVVQPYAFGGLGMTRFNIVNEDFNTSNIENQDTALHVPFGGGIAFGAYGLLVDVRGTIRSTFNDDLVGPDTDDGGPFEDDDNDSPDMHSWNVTARIGWEF